MGLRFFTIEEFRCRCGCGEAGMDGEFLLHLDRARGMSEAPFRIRSGYRCPAHNAAVGGVPGSAHTRGLAADIECPDNEHRYQILTGLWAVGFDRIGIGRDFVHVDADPDKPSPRVWLY
jgi:uncharacterized protein YcbK (DUF882 family)